MANVFVEFHYFQVIKVEYKQSGVGNVLIDFTDVGKVLVLNVPHALLNSIQIDVAMNSIADINSAMAIEISEPQATNDPKDGFKVAGYVNRFQVDFTQAIELGEEMSLESDSNLDEDQEF